MICKDGTSNLKSSQTGSSLSQRSTTSLSRNTRRDSRKDIGRFWIRALSRWILIKKNGRDTIYFECGCFEHRTLVSNNSFCETAQYLRSIYELARTIRLDRGRKERKTERIRDQKCVVNCGFLRSKTLGIASKTSIWKQFAKTYSGLRVIDRDNSIHKGMRVCIVPAHGIS